MSPVEQSRAKFRAWFDDFSGRVDELCGSDLCDPCASGTSSTDAATSVAE